MVPDSRVIGLWRRITAMTIVTGMKASTIGVGPTMLAVVALIGSCNSGDDSVALDTTVPISTTAPAPTPAISSPVTVAPSTPETSIPITASATSTVPTPTTPPTTCPRWNTGSDSDGFPNRMSSLVGTDIRTGAHPCFERVVIELAGPGGFPGWLVGYEDDVYLGQSGETIEVLGDANLVIHLASWMQTMEGGGYGGPRQIFPTNVTMIKELRLADNSEGYMVWAFGVDRERPFNVSVLDGPPRLVVDIAVGANA